MSKLTLEGLADIEQRFSSSDAPVVRVEAFLSVCKILREILQADKIVPMDEVERGALKRDIDDKRQEIITLRKENNILNSTILNWKTQNDVLLEKIGASPDLQLLEHLSIIEKRFKDKFDEGLLLRTEGKLSEFAMTNVTLGYHLVYAAKTAWQSALKEAAQHLEPSVKEPPSQ